MPIVYLDSNIYRQMGLRFVANVDYINLSKLLESSGNEFGLLEIVFSELMDYYENDIFESLFSDHQKLYKRFQTNPYLANITAPEITDPIKKAIASISKDLNDKKHFTPLITTPPRLLLNFLLTNKRTTRKDNTRDFLIFNTVCTLCTEEKDEHFILISQDEIFQTNEFFKKVITDEKIKNLKIYQSIPEFLKDFGPKLDFVTPESILANIDPKIIQKELLNDIKCLPSYVSQFYYDKKEKDVPEIENLVIKNISVNNYYIVKDYKTDTLKLNVTLKVDIKAIFKPELNKEELDQFLNSIDQRPYSSYKNTFDKEGKVIFEHNILFIFEGPVEERKRMIEQLSFIDFIPDYFIEEQILKQLARQPMVVDRLQCQHDLNKEAGYWKNSQYGGGLSWHYRCKKCGLEYDTGDFYD